MISQKGFRSNVHFIFSIFIKLEFFSCYVFVKNNANMEYTVSMHIAQPLMKKKTKCVVLC